MRKIKNICLVILALATAYISAMVVTWLIFGMYDPWYCVGGIILGLPFGLAGAYVYWKNDFIIAFGQKEFYASTVIVLLIGMAGALILSGCMVVVWRFMCWRAITDLMQSSSGAWGQLFGGVFVALASFRARREKRLTRKDTTKKKRLVLL